MKAPELFQEEEYHFPYHYLDLATPFACVDLLEYCQRLVIIQDCLQPIAGKRILDAGCGDGRLSYELKRAGAEVVGVDQSARAIAFARAFNPDVPFFLQDLRQLDLPFKFDAAVLMEVLEHLPPKEVPLVLERIAHHLKPDGQLIVTVPSMNLPRSPKHYRHFDSESLRETLSRHFEVEKILGYGLLQGRWRQLYEIFYRVVLMVLPIARRLGWTSPLLGRLYAFYRRRLALGAPDACLGLIALCRRRPHGAV